MKFFYNFLIIIVYIIIFGFFYTKLVLHFKTISHIPFNYFNFIYQINITIYFLSLLDVSFHQLVYKNLITFIG